MTGYKNILVAYPSETGQLTILEDGLSFGKIMNTKTDVVHIAEPFPDPMDYMYYTGPELVLIEKAQDELKKLRTVFKEHLTSLGNELGTEAELKEAAGNPAQAVVDMSPDYSLVIIGSGKEGEKTTRHLGPTARNVVRFAESPVLVLREWKMEKRIRDVKSILVPVDGSNVANFAAAHAALIADKLDAEVTLLHIWEKKDDKMLAKIKRDNVDIFEIKYEISGRVLEDAEHTMITGRRVKKNLLDGEPSEIIVSESEKHDLIVMGTWGKGGIKKFLLGCTAENVAQHAHCPVLLVRGIPD